MGEHEKAREWRKSHELTQVQLAELTGYSSPAISWFERGLTPPRTTNHKAGSTQGKSRRINGAVWKRYKMVCAAVDRQLRTKKEFDW